MGKSRVGWLGVMGLCTVLSAAAQERPADFSTQVPLSISGAGPWYRLDLPLSVQLMARQADLSDVRIFNRAGEAQAYALLRAPAQTTENRTVSAVKWFALYTTADTIEGAPKVRVQTTTGGTLVDVTPVDAQEGGKEVLRGWLLDASAIKTPLQQLVLDWTSERDGFEQFSIEASDDLQHWRPWGEGQVARLSFGDERVEQHEVALPGQSARYLRLLWKAPRTAPMLTSAQLVSSTSSTQPAPLVWSAPLAASREGAGEYSWQLPAALSLQQVQIELKQANTLAPVTLLGRRDSRDGWHVLSRGLLSRLSRDGQDVVQDQLQLSGQPVQQLKLQVDERGGGLGVDAPVLRFAVRGTQVVFIARGEPPYVLALGNPTVKAANLPVSTLIPDYNSQPLTGLGLATVEEDSALTAAPPAAAGPDWKRIGLWAVLLLGVLALGAMAFSLLRQSPAKP